jgi:hypothetical protein
MECAARRVADERRKEKDSLAESRRNRLAAVGVNGPADPAAASRMEAHQFGILISNRE